MEGQLKQALTYPAEQYSQSFFRQLPTDTRFLQCTYQKFMPNSSIGMYYIALVFRRILTLRSCNK